MPKVWDILTPEEKHAVERCEEFIWNARSVRQQKIYEEKASLIMDKAKKRYFQNRLAALEAQNAKDEQAAASSGF